MKNVLVLFLSILLFSNFVFAKSKSGAPKLRIHGLTFGDYFYNTNDHDPSKKDLNGVKIRRVYFTGDFRISKNFSSRFRLETDYIGKPAHAELGVKIKDSWLKWHNIFKGSDLVFGLSPTPAYDVSEGVWGHRYLEKTIMDLNHIVSSRDLGVDLKGKLDQKGTVKYWVKLGNNSGGKAEANKYKRYYGMLQFTPSKNLLLTVYSDYASTAPTLDQTDGAMKNNNVFVGAFFLNYKQKDLFSLGLKGYIRSQQNNFASSSTGALENQTGEGLSIWAYADLSKTVELVGRFDTVDPNTKKDNDGKSLILAGVQFSPAKNIDITPNVEVFTYQGSEPSDVTPRVTFYWKF